MSAAEGKTRARIAAPLDALVADKRVVSFSLANDADSAVIRAWLAAKVGQGDDSPRIRRALAVGIQLFPNLERIEGHLAVLARIEAHLTNVLTSTALERSNGVGVHTRDNPLTHAEEAALAALLDTD